MKPPVGHRDIIVIGASAGGIEALRELVAGLPADLQASVFVVVHVSPHSPSTLPDILSKAGPLPASHACDGERFEKGRIYVAPPDLHVVLEAETMLVRRSPKENRFRPSIDALFRSAAYVLGARVVGVVLSGVLDDGTSGLWTIKRLGGLAVVQDPADALCPAMPLNVMANAEVDHIAPAAKIGPLLGSLVADSAGAHVVLGAQELRRLELEVDVAHGETLEKHLAELGELSCFTCPECSGPLVQIHEGALVRFRCHTGHGLTASTLLAGISETIQDTLVTAMRATEAQAMLLEHMAKHLDAAGRTDAASVFRAKMRRARSQAKAIHDALPEYERLSGDSSGG
jgi:two-component system chemotaxis response regulator CheB